MANSLGGLGSGIAEQALLHTHTAYLARLLRVDLEQGVADVQPLTLQKPLGGKGTVSYTHLVHIRCAAQCFAFRYVRRLDAYGG